jgi:hypothetical protein
VVIVRIFSAVAISWKPRPDSVYFFNGASSIKVAVLSCFLMEEHWEIRNMATAAHVAELQRRHDELDEEIRRLQARPSSTEEELNVLKRRKLELKDQIASFKVAVAT